MFPSVGQDEASVPFRKTEAIADSFNMPDNDKQQLLRSSHCAQASRSATCGVLPGNAFEDAVEAYRKAFAGLMSADLIAALVVAVVAVPQAVAFASIAGLPPQTGLFAAVFPPLAYTFTGSSAYLVVGPTSVQSLVIFSGVSKIGDFEPEEAYPYAITITLMTGVIQLALAVVGGGKFFSLVVSDLVLRGFTASAAVTIAINQLPAFLGVPKSDSSSPLIYLIEVIENAINADILWVTPVIATIGLVPLLITRFSIPYMPWNGLKRVANGLATLTVAVIAVIVFSTTTIKGVKMVGSIPSGFPDFVLPKVGGHFWSLFASSIVSAIIGYLEAISIASAFERSNSLLTSGDESRFKSFRVDPGQELTAIGISNLVSTFLFGYAVTGSFSRTALNNAAGAQTCFASGVTALLVFAGFQIFGFLFAYLPRAILSSIVIAAVVGLMSHFITDVKFLWKHGKRQELFVYAVTYVCVLALGVEYGLGIGIACNLVLVSWLSSRSLQIQAAGDKNNEKESKTLFLSGPVLFPSSTTLEQRILELKPSRIDCSGVSEYDSSFVRTIERFGIPIENGSEELERQTKDFYNYKLDEQELDLEQDSDV